MSRSAWAPIASHVVPRVRLFEQLDRSRASPITLICAPAGYGKSLLAASWLSDRRVDTAVWVNVASGRDSSGELWATIARAIAGVVAQAEPAAAAELVELGALGRTAPGELPARLARWLQARDGEVVLVIDDLHAVVDQDFHEELIELVTKARDRLRLVALTRHDPPWPLHRLRLDGLLRDFRADSLAFDEAEAAALFELLEVAVGPTEIAHVLARTQGWAAGLRLAAIGALSSADPAGFVESVSGRSDYIADYLMREVYDALDRGWQDFLATIGVVDEICADLAVALGAGAESEHRLRALARQNAFIHRLGGDRSGWYRLHPLLVDFLRSRATDGRQRRALQRAAAGWFVAQGEPLTALRYALAAQDWPVAGDLVGRNVVSWTVCRPPRELGRMLASVPREVVLTEPGLAIGVAASLSMAGRIAGVEELTDAARRHLDRVDDQCRRRYAFVLDLIEFGNRRFVGDLDSVLRQFRELPTDQETLSELGLADWFASRTLLINNIGTAELWTGDWQAAAPHLAEAARVDGNRPLVLPTLNAQAHLGYLRWAAGELRAAEVAARTAIEHFERLGIGGAVQSRSAYLAMAGVALDRDDLAAAEDWIAALRRTAREPQTDFAAELMTARILAAGDKLFDAIAAVRAARAAVAGRPLPEALVDQSWLLEAQLLTMAGSDAAAQVAGARIGVPLQRVAPGPDTPRARVEQHLGRARKAIGQADADSATADEAASAELESALCVAAPEQLRQPFLAFRAVLEPLLRTRLELGTREPVFAVELVDRITARTPPEVAISPAIFTPLTKRERNVLRYLATTMTTKEIAQSLYVSVNTVKTHQRSIYQKLGANERRQAVVHARALALI